MLDPGLVERCVQLVRDLAASETRGCYAVEARVIVAELPAPVDPDWKLAGEICEAMGFGQKPWEKRGNHNNSADMKNSSQDAAYIALKRGRELALSERGQ